MPFCDADFLLSARGRSQELGAWVVGLAFDRSGACGFGLGATPNAIANMNAMCERYGSAHTAYFVIPLIGAFVVDFLNASILMVFMNLLK